MVGKNWSKGSGNTYYFHGIPNKWAIDKVYLFKDAPKKYRVTLVKRWDSGYLGIFKTKKEAENYLKDFVRG